MNGLRRCYSFGEFRLDPNRHRLWRNGAPVPLSSRAIETLTVLVRNPGRLIQRQDLMAAVWPDTIVEDANLTVAISHLRKAFSSAGETEEFIQTIPRVGYRFVGDLHEENERAPTLAADPPASATESEQITADKNIAPVEHRHAPESSIIPRQTKNAFLPTRPLVIAIAVILSASALGLLGYLTQYRPEGLDIRSVAVLPLKNLSGDPNDDYIVDGLTEDLISSLSKIDGLKVISRGSVFAFKGKEIDPRDAGRRLGVHSVVEGSFLKSKDSTRVWLRLVNAVDGRVVWSKENVTDSPANVFSAEDELERSLSKVIRPTLATEQVNQIAGRPVTNPEAYALYLKGRYFWNRRTGQDLERAINYFEQAIQLDPSYALAYSGLADCYAVLSYFSSHPFSETFPKARAAAERALALDGSLAEPHATLGFVISGIDWDWARSGQEYQRALELNPNYPTAHHWYSWYLNNLGRKEESVREMRRALELDPVSLEINVDLGLVLINSGQPDEAIKYLQAALEIDPYSVDAEYGLGLAYLQKNDFERAIIKLEKAHELSQDRPDVLAFLGNAYGRAGRTAEARSVLTQLEEMRVKSNVSPVQVAKVYLGLNEKEKALQELEMAYQARSISMLDLPQPTFDPLRNDPRFRRLLLGVGLIQG